MPSIFFPTVNLPGPILIHALGLFFGGLKLAFTPPPSQPDQPDDTIAGITTSAIGLCYLFTSYMPPEQNVFLYASAPVRIILGGIAAARLAMDYYIQKRYKGARRSRSRQTLWFIMLYDTLGGIAVGWWLGTFSGRIPAYDT